MPTSNSYAFEQLTPADVGGMKRLLTVFADVFDDLATYQGAVPSDAYLTGLLAKPHFIALVARADDEIAGGLAAYVLEKFEQDRSEAYIYDLAVLEAHRRRGVATGLIELLQTVAGRRGAYVIYVQADLTDDPAIALYSKLGVREDVLHFDIAVADEAGADRNGR